MWLCLVVVLMVAVASCARQTPTPTPPGSAMGEAAARAAIALVAGEMNVSTSRVTVQSIEAVDWPDTSLGNPQPGKAYAQVVTPGYRIILRVGDVTREVHTNADGQQATLLAPGDATPAPAGTLRSTLVAGTPAADEPLPEAVGAAIRFLAGELNIAAEGIAIKQVEMVEWQDSSLGNPQPGQFYAQMITPGYRVVLVAQGREYELHTDATGKRVVVIK